MKNTGRMMTYGRSSDMAQRSTQRTGSLSRPIIGHTPRKLPPLGAISRFIAVPRTGHPLPHSLYIIKENPLDVKGIFSVFDEIFQKFLEVIPLQFPIIFGRTPSRGAALALAGSSPPAPAENTPTQPPRGGVHQ